jgi:phosphoribosyl 1,2-cyclic phosphodiesterase
MLLFRTIRSGSSGNLLLLEAVTGRAPARLLIDCGVHSQRGGLEILETEVGLERRIDGLLVTHAHSDHVNYPALRLMDRLRIPVYLHDRTSREVSRRYLNPYRVPARVDFSGLELRCFAGEPFELAGFEVMPIPIPHAPEVTTHAFLIRRGRRSLLLASDLGDPEAVAPYVADRDLIYLESNHDLELLRRFFNPASLYHLPNPAAGLLLLHGLTQSRRLPRQIVLAHLSEERNRPELALGTVRQILAERGLDGEIPLATAPRYQAGEAVRIEA